MQRRGTTPDTLGVGKAGAIAKAMVFSLFAIRGTAMQDVQRRQDPCPDLRSLCNNSAPLSPTT